MKIEYENLVDEFLKFEQEYNLLDLNYKGIYFWRLARSDLFEILSNHISEQNSSFSPHKKKWFFMLKDLFRYSRNFNKSSLDSHVKLVIASSRFIRDNGKLQDLFLQHEIDDCNCNVLHPSQGNGQHYFIHKGKLIIEDWFFYLFRSIYHLKIKIKRTKHKDFSELESLFNKNFNINLDLSIFIRNKILLFRIDSIIFRRLLKKTKPNQIVLTDHYSLPIALVSIANKLGIKVTEYQHGLINEAHLGYHFPGKFSVPYFPDELVLFGEFWKEQFQPPKSTVISVRPNPNYQKRIRQVRESNEKTRFDILDVSNDSVFNELVIEFAESHKELNIMLKLHPGSNGLIHNQGFHYSEFNSPDNLKIIFSELNIYDCLMQCSKVVGTNSTTLFESLASGKPTYILRPNLQPKAFTEMINKGYLFGINELEEITKIHHYNHRRDLSIFFG
jgi:hypothetical protein